MTYRAAIITHATNPSRIASRFPFEDCLLA